ncbi:MAG: type II toxin-antitoxin system RelE/ParE family toxin [Acutalibacteraceae bacterium]
MTEIKFSPDAINDLQQIKAYITEDLCNEQAAIFTINKIMKRIRLLESFPESGAPLASILDLDVDYRFLVCGNYTAFYRVENDAVFIVRILYGRRDFMRILFGTPQDES